MAYINPADLATVRAAVAMGDPAIFTDITAILDRVDGFTASAALRDRAHEIYGTDDIEIDDEAPATSPNDEGCWVAAWVFVHADLWTVELKASDIQTTASDEAAAERFAYEDAGQFRASWNYTLGDVEKSTDADMEPADDVDGAELEMCCTDSESGWRERLFTFEATYTVPVMAMDRESAIDAALALIGASRANLKGEEA